MSEEQQPSENQTQEKETPPVSIDQTLVDEGVTEPDKHEGGRPPLSEQDKIDIVQKLRSYLNAGLSVKKACQAAKVPHVSVYEYMKKDPEFANRIDIEKNYLSILLSSSMVSEIQEIIRRQQKGKVVEVTLPDGSKVNMLVKRPMSKLDWRKMTWFALHSNIAKEEFEDRKNVQLFDPEIEIGRITALIDQVANDGQLTSGDQSA